MLFAIFVYQQIYGEGMRAFVTLGMLSISALLPLRLWDLAIYIQLRGLQEDIL